MAAFEYEALDKAGRKTRGVISADTARLARRELKRKRLVPIRLEAAAARRATGARRLSLSRFTPRDLSLVTRQLSTLLDAGAPVEEALQTIASQSEKQTVKKTLLSVRAAVMEGYKLSDALGQAGGAFSPLYRSMVAAGEAAGSLGPVLGRLAEYLEKQQKMRGKVQTALTYPAFLALTALGVVIALMTFVVPKVVEQFDTLGQELPALTVAMIWASDALRQFGPFALIAIAGGGLAFAHGLRSEGSRRRVDRAVLKLPVIGRLVREMQAARLARTLSTLVSSGVPVVEGLAAARDTVRNTALRDALSQTVTLVREGASLAKALRRADAFPPLVVYMAAVGENSGRLDTMLAKAADYLESEFEAVTQAALSLLEPTIIIVMGAMVTVIVLAILMPILQLNTLTMM